MNTIEKIKKILNENNVQYYDVDYSSTKRFVHILYKDLELSNYEAEQNKAKLNKLFTVKNWLEPNILSIPKCVI